MTRPVLASLAADGGSPGAGMAAAGMGVTSRGTEPAGASLPRPSSLRRPDDLQYLGQSRLR